MSYELSQEHTEFRHSVRDFAEAEIAPHAAEWDRKHYFPVEVVKKMGRLGLFGLTAPEEYGGSGGDFTSLCLAIEEISRVDQSMGITLEAAVGLGINPILTYGTDEQKAQWLPDLVAGEKLDGGEWVINGAKQFITNSGSEITSLVTVTARTGRSENGTPEISTIIVPSGTPGFTAEPAYDKLGWHASDTHPLTFVDARVPESNLLGDRGRGYAQFLATLDDGRVAIAAVAVGCIQACLDLSVQYAGERQTFGVPIGRKQGLAFQISDLQVMLDASRLLTYKAAAMKDAGASSEDFKQAAAVAKLYATESAVTATRIATQVFGGYGFMEEYAVARFYRDAKVLEIGEGTSEVQRILIARSLGLPVE